MSWYVMTFSLAAVIAPLVGTAVYELGHSLFWNFSLGIGVFALIGLTWLSRSVESRPAKAQVANAS